MPQSSHYIDPIRARGQHTRQAGAGPSIFLISVDMVSPDMYGRGRYAEHIQTPNIDQLRRDGVWFDNAFCNSPLCGPSRASYLTGRYAYLTVNEERAHDGFETELRTDDIIFPEYLRHSSYCCRHVGKCHVGTGKFMDAFGENDSPWNRWAPPLSDDDAYGIYRKELGVQGMRFRREVRGLMPDRSTPGNSYGGWVEQVTGDAFPVEATYPHYLARRAAQIARLHAGRHQPLYLQLDFFAPHQPFFVPAGNEEREAELREIVEIPESYSQMANRDFAPLPDEPYVYQQYSRHWGLYEEQTMRDYLVAHLLQMEVLDGAIGVFLDALSEAGFYEDSMIIFLGDHGEMNGHRALIDKGVYGHPRVERVPLCLKLPHGESAGQGVSAPVCLLDLAPTVLQTAGISPRARLDGESLLPLVHAEKSERDRPFIFESGWHVTANPAVSIQKQIPGRGHFLYTYNVTSPIDELYDLSDQTYRNLAPDENYRDVLTRMMRELGTVLQADRRWRCYWHSYRLEKHAELEIESGDTQMFVPD
jgi:arylsulfatase A-like enzyme